VEAGPPADEFDDDGASIVFNRPAEEAEMDMTPMVDIVFQLLIFFMVTASFSMQKSQAFPKPKDDRPSSMAQPEPPDPDLVALTIHVDHQGAFRLENEDGDMEEAPSEQELVTKLRQARSIVGPDATITVMVKANGEAPHYRVVMAIDSAATAGFGKVGLETVEENE